MSDCNVLLVLVSFLLMDGYFFLGGHQSTLSLILSLPDKSGSHIKSNIPGMLDRISHGLNLSESMAENTSISQHQHCDDENRQNRSSDSTYTSPSRYAYIFLAYSKPIDHVVIAAQSLRLTGTSNDIILMMSETLKMEDLGRHERFMISQQFTSVRSVPPIASPYSSRMYDKINCWKMTEYEKILYLDSDVLVFENLDSVFEEFGDHGFAAAPDVFEASKFNAGVLLLKPSKEIFRSLETEAANTTMETKDDQGFFNIFFSSWFTSPPSYRLPFKYNAIIHLAAPGYTLPLNFDLDRAHQYLGPLSLVHFANPWFKPWRWYEKKYKLVGRGGECSEWCNAWLRVQRQLWESRWTVLNPDEFQIMDDFAFGWVDSLNPHALHRYPPETLTASGLLNPETGVSFRKEPWLWEREKMPPPVRRGLLGSASGLVDGRRDAFATLLTNESEAHNLGVWGLSYREHHGGDGANQTRDTVLVVLSSVSRESWLPYQSLFSEIVVVDPMERVQQNVGGALQNVTLLPEFAVLKLWGESFEKRYRSVVFVHLMSLFWGNCNKLFENYGPFAAPPTAFPGDRFNWRTMVIGPEKDTHTDMLSKLDSPDYPTNSVEDFLNAYFHDWFTSSSLQRLPMTYAVDVTLKPHMMRSKDEWKVVSFDPRFPPPGKASIWTVVRQVFYKTKWQEFFCQQPEGLRPSYVRVTCPEESSAAWLGDLSLNKTILLG